MTRLLAVPCECTYQTSMGEKKPTVCFEQLDASHILGREHDEPKIGADGRPLKELLVHPARIIPACGPYPLHCHGAQHRHEVDTLRYLTLDEQLMAVKDAGSIEAARIRLIPAPSAYVEGLAS